MNRQSPSEPQRTVHFVRTLILLNLLLALPANGAPAADFAGEWRTSFGVVTVKQTAGRVTGTYGDAGQFTLEGTVAENKLTFAYREGDARGAGEWTLDESKVGFRGTFQVQGG